MVRGLDHLREHFVGYSDRYVLIGGTAATVTMEEAGLAFRATKDLDILLVVEALDTAFGERMWQFVNQGGYEIRQASSGHPRLYRFEKPTNAAYPHDRAVLATARRSGVGRRCATLGISDTTRKPWKPRRKPACVPSGHNAIATVIPC